MDQPVETLAGKPITVERAGMTVRRVGVHLGAEISGLDLRAPLSDDQYAAIEDALVELEQNGMRALIFDLRNNPGGLLTAAVELKNLAEASFSGAEAKVVLSLLKGLNEEEWKADRMARSLSKDVYRLETELDPITIIFYEKMILSLGAIANEAENAGDMLRTMILK